MRQGKAKVLNESEFRHLLRVISLGKHALRNTAVLFVSFGLGLRVGEIASLLIGDVMDETGRVRDQFQIRRENSKTNQNREVFLSNAKVRRALQDYLDDRLQDRIVVTPTSPLFRSQKGGAFTANSLQQMLKSQFRKAGLPETVSSHSGRRTAATRMITSGADLVSVSKILGHANVGQTAAYCETSPDVLKAITARVI